MLLFYLVFYYCLFCYIAVPIVIITRLSTMPKYENRWFDLLFLIVISPLTFVYFFISAEIENYGSEKNANH